MSRPRECVLLAGVVLVYSRCIEGVLRAYYCARFGCRGPCDALLTTAWQELSRSPLFFWTAWSTSWCCGVDLLRFLLLVVILVILVVLSLGSFRSTSNGSHCSSVPSAGCVANPCLWALRTWRSGTGYVDASLGQAGALRRGFGGLGAQPDCGMALGVVAWAWSEPARGGSKPEWGKGRSHPNRAVGRSKPDRGGAGQNRIGGDGRSGPKRDGTVVATTLAAIGSYRS